MRHEKKQPVPHERGGLLYSVSTRVQNMSRCLGWRLVFLLVGSLVVLLGASGWLALQLHRQHLLSLLEESAIGIGETILDGARFSMLENDQRNLARIVDNVGSRDIVVTLRLLDARGEVRYSNHQDEVGKISDLQAPLCQGCHTKGETRTPASLREGLQLYSPPSGSGRLGLGVPVLNSPECSNAACHIHPPNQRVLGMLDLELSTVNMETALRDGRRQFAGLSLITVLIISATLGLLAWRVVHRPIRLLLSGTRRVGSGDLSFRIQDVPIGEIGELASSFNDMSSRLETAKGELEQWNQRLEAKVKAKTRELEQARDQMVFAEKMASLGKLAAIVAHEINNPLAGVLVYTKLVRKRLLSLAAGPGGECSLEKRDDLTDKLLTVETEIARCGDIVRNLLQFSRPDDVAAVPADINAIVERSVKLVQHQADLGDVGTRIELSADLPSVVCGPAQIQQALIGILINALEAMADGGSLTVRTRFVRERNEVEIDVEDTGIGIPETLRGRIFEPFFSTKTEGKGTGLGLSVAYGIIHHHGGRIEFDSVQGQGTVFRIFLPLDFQGFPVTYLEKGSGP